jgi:hypothetical protein
MQGAGQSSTQLNPLTHVCSCCLSTELLHSNPHAGWCAAVNVGLQRRGSAMQGM